MSKFIKFNTCEIETRSTSERNSLIDIKEASVIDPQTDALLAQIEPLDTSLVVEVIFKIRMARKAGKPVILCMGAHAIKNGCGTIINSLIKNDIITHVAGNGAVAIHDTEFSMFGHSTENVRENLANGSFGIWKEIGAAWNEALAIASFEDIPLGNAFGQISISRVNPYGKYSVGYGAFHHKIPFTIHPCMGQDIISTYPDLDWGLLGKRSREDFLYFAESIRNLSNGVYLSVGSAVMSPMIFEKALSMARHVEQKNGNDVKDFTIVVNDIIPEPDFDWSNNKEPSKDDPAYYLRFLKSFNRSGGDVKYVSADNRRFLYSLWKELVK